jgi:hypothetical protein
MSWRYMSVVCGAKMAREGFGAWIDEPDGDAAAERIAARHECGRTRKDGAW